jgi:hypothetical protein
MEAYCCSFVSYLLADDALNPHRPRRNARGACLRDLPGDIERKEDNLFHAQMINPGVKRVRLQTYLFSGGQITGGWAGTVPSFCKYEREQDQDRHC